MQLVLFMALLVCTGCATIATRRPNIVFLFADDQRADTIAALGNPHIQTPNLDGLVRNGFSFTRAYAMGSQQPAVCIPSRAMLLTGRALFAATNTNAPARIPKESRMWPEHFRAAGYQTIGIGKWHNDRASFNRAFGGGGPIFFGGMMNHTNVEVHDYHPEGKYRLKGRNVADKHSSELFADAAIAQIKAMRDQAFVLYVAFTAPHDPRNAPAAYLQRYSAAKPPLPANFMLVHPFDNGEMQVRDELLLSSPRNPEAVREELAAYYAMITHLDAQIGRILQTLRDTGLERRTIVVYAADNGLALGSHGLLGKQNLYEHSVRVPLVFSGWGISPGQSAALCYLYDVHPTLCELAGLKTPATVQGKSLVPIVRDRQDGVRDAILCAYRDVQRMIAEERWKLISYPRTGRIQLFDLANDPQEINDLSGNPAHGAHLAKLARKLAATQRAVNDPLLSTP